MVASPSRTLFVAGRCRRFSAALGATALVLTGLGVMAPAANAAASVTSAVFSGGSYTATDGVVYAKQGAALTLTVRADANTSCVRVTIGNGVVEQTRTGTADFVFSGGLPEFTAGSGNGLVPVTSVIGFKNSNGKDKCVANQGETYAGQPSYVLDNTAPTATGALTPAPNGAGWNKSDVIVTWSGADTGGSGVKSVTPATDTVTIDGTVTKTATVTDNVGNTATSSPVTVKLDKTAPTITGSRTPAANANGWNNTDVTVSFAPADATSGVKTSSNPTTLTGSAANQSVTGTVTDNADNTASTTVSGISIDKVAPTLSGSPTTPANGAGWYNGDVAVAWTAADALSGTTNPPNSTITGEGTALTSSATATDKAGNTTNAQSAAVKIDRTAPNTTVTAPPAWNKTDVTLTLVPNDGLSGVDKTFYQLDGGAQTAGTSVPVTAEGNHSLKFWSTDLAGNTEAAHTVSFGIDKTSPTIGHTQNPAANGDGWNNSNVTVTFNCSDALSGVASCTAPQTVTTEGRTQTVTGSVRDNAGNTATDPAAVSIDKTKPVITVDALPAPNANGWYGDDVTATYTASDVLSGVKTQDRAHTFGEGATQTDTATATDTAGNSASVTTPVVNVDKTAPTLTGKVVGTPNAKGWFTGDVTVHWTCADNLSGVVACPADSVVKGEGSDRSASASISDKAGHTATATVDGIKIDRTAPTTTPSGVPGGWVNAPVSVGLSASDNLSDVDSTYYAVDGATTPTKGNTVTVGAEGVHSVSYYSVDNAGNTEAAKSFTVKVDLSSPSITPSQSPDQNVHGWNNTDVAVSFACEDQTALSGLKDCTVPRTVSTEGKAQKVTGTATDNAGNSVTGTATVNLDKTAPTITGAPDRAANPAGWYKADITVSFDGTDGLSGIDTVTGPQHLAEGANQSATGTAVDNAGNSATASVSGINVDKTAPTLSAAPTAGPNGNNGWYTTDVTQVWAADDALSGLAGPVPADSVLSTEGRGQRASAAVTDKAGNTTSATSEPVNIDKTAPRTDVALPSGWVNTGVEVTLTPHDALSGVDSTQFSVDGGAQQAGTTITLTAEGTHTISYASTDKAGNVEGATTVVVLIDKSNPTITHKLSPVANGNGWNNADVTVTFTCADQADLSGIATCTAPQKVTTEGKGHKVDGTATDKAGNTATDTATVNLDKTAPVITGAPDRKANTAGWYDHDVTVSFSGTDALSGIDTVTGPQHLGEGAGQTVTGTAIDSAGNSDSTTLSGINVDETAPTLSVGPTTKPNGNGWYNTDVTQTWTADDALSGLAGDKPADSVLSTEGEGQTASASVTDKAGNTTSATSAPVKIDKTAPSTDVSAPSGWVNSSVDVALTPHDALSGVDTTHYAVDGGDVQTGTTVTLTTEGTHTISYGSTDKAGNAEAAKTVTVQIDKTDPTITHTLNPAANVNGWNNADVTVTFTCDDQPGLSGVKSCTAPQTVTAEGAKQPVKGTATDNAGNTASDPATVSLDKTKPTIVGSRTPAPNSYGWNNTDVTASFDGKDTLSGIDSVTAPKTFGEGDNQSLEGTAVDAAGNSASATVGGINVDKTAPTLSGKPTVPANDNGWYQGDVTIEWTAADDRSGVASAPANSTITGEGDALLATTTVADKAGNSTTTSSPTVKIDRVAPTTTADAPDGWVSRTEVTLKLTATDGLSTVDHTYFTVDSGAQQTGNEVTLAAEGAHAVSFWSVDKAGNAEKKQTVDVRIDRTPPTITHSQAPEPNGRGWNRADVTVTFDCADQVGLSGIASCTGPQTVAIDGAAQRVDGSATDTAGNTADDSATVNLDKTKPTITGSRTPGANSYGWNKTDVTVHFDGKDTLSGIYSVTPDKTFGEGTSQSLEGTAVDVAGNSASATVDGINVDETAPTLSGRPTVAANGNGWYKGDVTIDWTAADERSGIASAPANSTITGEGSGLKDTATVTDKAGNSTTADSAAVNIDRTAPTTGADAPAGWNNSTVTVSLEAADGLSGVDATYYAVDSGDAVKGTSLTIDTEGVHTLKYWSVDQAGNTEAAQTATVKVDLTAPTVGHTVTPAPNTKGWNNTPVTVAYQCDDKLSGVATCSPDAKVSTDGQDQAVPGTAVDNAGNSFTDNATVSIDTVAPRIGGRPDRAANANGWYAGDVTVGFRCRDTLSGIASCPAPTTLGEGKAQSVTGTATDTAGNSKNATVGPINIDKTAPTLSGAATADPNGAGWYNDDVTVKWSAADALSGLDGGAAPADSTIGGEGTALTAGTSVRDLAGNVTSAKSAPVKIDRTAPTTTVSDVSDWSNSAVTVKLTAGDNLSGVAATHYQLDKDAAAIGTSVTIDTEGVHTLQVWSVDVAGNVEAQQNIGVKIDKTAPGISHTQAPAANTRSWNNSDVTVTFTCTDSGSGIASCTDPVTKGEGAAQKVEGKATDKAGNSATDETTVNVDKTKPTVTGTLSADANANGWFKADVTTTFKCADQDGLSGILSCPAAKTLGEGANQSAGGTATDAADNASDAFSITGVNVDKTDPTLSGAVTTAPNGNGWYNGDVTVKWTAGDALSGIDGATPADSTITSEGGALSTSASVSDKAGNTVSTTVKGVKIDRHAPSTDATAPSGWQSTDVTVKLSATDNLSGVAGTYYTVDGGAQQAGTSVSITSEGTHKVSYWSVDNAGNTETAGTATVLVDKTAPTITGKATTSPNAAGWYSSPVTVQFDCKDAVSGIASCQPDATLAAQGANSATGTAVDNAGNKGTTTVGGINVDTVAPSVTIGGVKDGAQYVIGAVPTATASATDGTSGLAAPATGTRTGGTANGVGTFTYTATATDKAGNTGTAKATYTVVYGYGTTLFLQPVNDTAHQTGLSTSVFNAGQTIPMKFQLKNSAGQVIQAGSAPKWLAPVKVSTTAAAVNETATTDTATTGATYVWDGTQYQFNWKTDKTQAGSYWRVGVTLDDGQTYFVNIGLK
ncbi:OmpL47-type beta-barrel domain-containing protein [Pedococcus sp. 5OH_020]|uniref:OmpL47-type beta-barrel domain-containing protein n=1 Tax=Pedococcus sp. 5OH_020 TaxID=2989814 RepID=UPI0022E9A3A9|nr:PxKF domain-containing protein [Pedococcus sp. 5OH_020]